MSPRTGRPPKVDARRVGITLRLKESSAKKLKQLSEELNVSRTDIIEAGIDLVAEKKKNHCNE